MIRDHLDHVSLKKLLIHPAVHSDPSDIESLTLIISKARALKVIETSILALYCHSPDPGGL